MFCVLRVPFKMSSTDAGRSVLCPICLSVTLRSLFLYNDEGWVDWFDVLQAAERRE